MRVSSQILRIAEQLRKNTFAGLLRRPFLGLLQDFYRTCLTSNLKKALLTKIFRVE